jgi:hypothetical protein
MPVIEIEPNATTATEPPKRWRNWWQASPTTATEPPKRWRNWWQASRDGLVGCGKCNVTWSMAKGDTVGDHCWTHPSRDVAETVAAKHCESPFALQYLGAYPEGERP